MKKVFTVTAILDMEVLSDSAKHAEKIADEVLHTVGDSITIVKTEEKKEAQTK